MDRLLSEQEIRTARAKVHLQPYVEDRRHEAVLKAQLAKADKEWAEWGQEICPHLKPIKFAEAVKGKGTTIYQDGVRYKHKFECTVCWEEHKKEIGL